MIVLWLWLLTITLGLQLVLLALLIRRVYFPPEKRRPQEWDGSTSP